MKQETKIKIYFTVVSEKYFASEKVYENIKTRKETIKDAITANRRGVAFFPGGN